MYVCIFIETVSVEILEMQIEMGLFFQPLCGNAGTSIFSETLSLAEIS